MVCFDLGHACVLENIGYQTFQASLYDYLGLDRSSGVSPDEQFYDREETRSQFDTSY